MATAHKQDSDPYAGAKLPLASSHIRLLHILPSGHSELELHRQAPLVCSFSIAEIASPAAYDALSYAWGDVSRPWPCWALLDDVQIPITLSLDTAIRYLRHETETKVVWIDQLCINQVDNVEKSDQILLMSQIYGKAKEVLAWLGPEADDSDAVMDAFRTVGDGAIELDMMSYFTREGLPVLMDILKGPDREPEDETRLRFRALQDEACKIFSRILHPMASWFGRDYFTRIWVVQEFALGAETNFVCGTERVPRVHVLLAMQILKSSVKRIENFSEIYQDFGPIIEEPTPAFFGAWRRRQKFEQGIGNGDELFHLLRSLHTENQMGTSDARDRVYGLMGLAVDIEKLGIKPDYVNSTYQSVMIETASAIAKTGRVEVLSFSQYPKVDSDLPSWVPDWRPTLRPSYYTIRENASSHFFSACGATTASILPTTDQNILGLEGFMIDTIERLGSPWWDDGWDHSRYLAFLTQVSLLAELSAAKPNSVYESPARRAEAVWRVPIADMFDQGQGGERDVPGALASYEALLEFCELFEEWKIMTSGEWEENGAASHPERREASNRYRASMGISNSMRPFLTVKGYLGLAATVAKEGDIVVVFKGGRIPYVVRRGQGERRFRFIGEAYCDGMMDGEIVEKAVAEEFYLV